MLPGDYIKKAKRTETPQYDFEEINGVTPRIEHAVYGMVTEAGELMDLLKRAKIYRRTLDKLNVIEEMGDLMWYMAIMSDELGVSFEEIWEKNIRKLKVRYPEKYSHARAVNKDLKRERSSLEN